MSTGFLEMAPWEVVYPHTAATGYEGFEECLSFPGGHYLR